MRNDHGESFELDFYKADKLTRDLVKGRFRFSEKDFEFIPPEIDAGQLKTPTF